MMTRIFVLLGLLLTAVTWPVSACEWHAGSGEKYVPGASSVLDRLPEKAPADKAIYRTLVLENNLRVILQSDPNLNKSSASMVIDAGSLQDPEERAGLAHFLEHMLFLGTEKYPDEAEYNRFLQANGGYSNAYTAGDHTNYHFEIGHHAFEGALDRFAQFFIAPLFTAEFTDREMNAVDSEHEKNLQNDGWRQMQLGRNLANPSHPANHFSTGNRQTLEGIAPEEFKEFYRQYYSANQMAVALTSPAGLDQMEAWARQYFGAVADQGRARVDFPADPILPSDKLRVVTMEPVKDLRKLEMLFGVPATRPHWRGKSAELISFILGYEGEGSLLSKLKEEGLATALGASVYDETKDYSYFNLEVELTPQGLAEWQRVTQIVFAGIDLLRRSEYPEYLFQERAVMARLDQVYQDKGEGTGRAVFLANQALNFPLEVAVNEPYLWEEPDPTTYFSVLEAMQPENLLLFLIAKGVPTGQQEAIYGTSYAIQEMDGELLMSLRQPVEVAGLTLPKPNPFIPSEVGLLAERPVKVVEEPGLTVYFSQDMEFGRPQVAYVIRVRQGAEMANLKNSVLKDLYGDVLNEMMNEVTYTAATAGLSAGVGVDTKGVTVQVSGYSQSADKLLRYVVEQLQHPEIEPDLFEALKDRRVRAWESFPLSDAYQQARAWQAKMTQETYFSPAERLGAARDLTLGDVQAFAEKLFAAGAIEAVVHGNVTAEQAVAAGRLVRDQLGLRPLEQKDLFKVRLLEQPAGERLVLTEKLKVNNSSLWQERLLGEDTPENRAAALILNNFISAPFYSEMRTKQQLGYIVWGFTTGREDRLYGGFVIQSADYPADELQRRAETFAATLPEQLEALSAEAYAELVAGARAEFEQKEKTIGEKASNFFQRAFEKGEDWERKQKTLDALEALDRAQVANLLRAMLDPATARAVTVLAFAEQHEAAAETRANVTDVAEWKDGRVYR